MNERIRELAEQAGLLPREIGPVVETRHMKNKQQSLEKFAELIVRECCDWIDGSPATDGGMLLLTKTFIIANLKGYFGVEE